MYQPQELLNSKKRASSYRFAKDVSMFSQFQYKESQVAKRSFSNAKDANTNNPMVQQVLQQLLKSKSQDMLAPSPITKSTNITWNTYTPSTFPVPHQQQQAISIRIPTKTTTTTSQLFKMNIKYILN